MCESESQCCDQCGHVFDAACLKQASMPSARALAAVDDGLAFDEPQMYPLAEPEDQIDRQLYCPACRWRVNLKRGLLLVMWCVAIPVLAHLMLGWL